MDHGARNYDVAGQRLPSVTTILGKTKDDTFLKDWIKKKGEKEAERIKNASAVRGTSMHKYLENYVLGKGYEDLTELGQETKRMAQKVIDVGLAPVSEYYGSEVTLYFPGLYAGSTDLVGIHNDKETVIDFTENNEIVFKYAKEMKAPGPARDYKRQDLDGSSCSNWGWLYAYASRFPNHENIQRLNQWSLL